MFKTIVKEFFILILLCIAIVLALGILMYDYIPIGKVIPESVKYEQPQGVATEIQNRQNVGFDLYNNNITYEVNSADLSVYEKTNQYNKGKANPFESTATNVNQNTTPTNTKTNTNTNQPNNPTNNNKNNTSTNTSNNANSSGTNTDSDGTYFNSINKK